MCVNVFKLFFLLFIMLQESFVVLPGVRSSTELKLWSQNVHSWDDFLGADKVKGISAARKDCFDWKLREFKHHLRFGNSSFFARIHVFYVISMIQRLVSFYQRDSMTGLYERQTKQNA